MGKVMKSEKREIEFFQNAAVDFDISKDFLQEQPDEEILYEWDGSVANEIK